ncbi:RagB/SusD family nutrient uptake outer membrane protein [Algibacter miyuki]|uniref:RagB/SusD family nutrient uptake outer membrane protein n=1 Tax=Algibacter miyuki TaxID=1306933 RepID=A0ABV5H065_9FLAO|nr:RagB/SusD family nutrient uptake outer membrane protein [Algibacter miyuki]MDN3667558.1 RagB/SusD family nutrient uptake outer membrane protein [Algibacter miyuki]
MKTIHKNILKKGLQKLHSICAMPLMMLSLSGLVSCEESFLEVVPDNVVTIDEAFKLRNEAEKYLYTCYAYIPKNGDAVHNIGMLAGNETWIPGQDAAINSYAFDIARGLQRISNPYMDAWEGRYQGAGPSDLYPLFDGIRHCNIFIDNMEDRSKVPDISEADRLRWIGEGKFLKAYYHYYLMRMYGPIPIIRNTIPVDAPESELQIGREPIDESVDYLVELLDEAALALPPQITDRQNELGRITRAAALGIKGELLLMVASPLFNGNSDVASFTNKDGIALFPASYDPEKWERAAVALKAAIDVAEANGHVLFYKEDINANISQVTKTKIDIRQAVTERFNNELIWANPNSRTSQLQRLCMMPLNNTISHSSARKVFSPTIRSASNFYTKNGVPIEEDKTLNFNDITKIKEAGVEDALNIKEGYRTSILNFNREPRFYADLGFDGAIFYKYDSGSDETKYHIEAKFKDYAGSSDAFDFNVTGYYIKKLVDWQQTFNSDGGASYNDYAWPELRLADLYLMYAEALNEVSGATPEVLQYVDAIRARAGLEGVSSSWQNYSTNPSKYTSKEGMREIIHRERSIELAYEGKNYWDIRRWKKATSEFNKPVEGWNVYGSTEAAYYQVSTLFQQRFVAPRDYFWPIYETTLIQNPSLVQSPGW